ncbi:unnamed protein product, partial [Meganyctiphanes norvegica]
LLCQPGTTCSPPTQTSPAFHIFSSVKLVMLVSMFPIAQPQNLVPLRGVLHTFAPNSFTRRPIHISQADVDYALNIGFGPMGNECSNNEKKRTGCKICSCVRGHWICPKRCTRQ